jgi:hypothetical protein
MGSGSTDGAPTLQSPLYPLFYCRNAGSGQRLGLAGMAWNTAWSESFVLVAAGRGMGLAPRASPPPTVLARLPVIANLDAVSILPAGRITVGVAQRAPGPFPSHDVVETAVMATAAKWPDNCCAQMFVLAAIIVATAPVVASPYLNTARGTAADTNRLVGGAIGDDAALGDATTAMASAGTAVLGDASPASNYVRGAHRHSLSCAFTEEELYEADP